MRSPTELETKMMALSKTTMSLSDCRRAIITIRDALSVDPSLINELAPGMALSPRRMTPKERGKIAILAMNVGRAKHHEAVGAAAEPIVRRTRELSPGTGGHILALELNKHCALGPSKARSLWTYADVRRLLKELNIELEPSKS